MALIVEQHVVADMYPVGTGAISAGMLVANAAGGVVANPASTATGFGIAGDSALSAEGSTTAYSAQVTIGADGEGSRWTENRVSDFYDETTASQKITVYNGGGKFWISNDLFDTSGSGVAINSVLMAGAVAGEWVEGGSNTLNESVALAVGISQAYDSGVPGTDTGSGSISLGDYVPIILRI